MAAAIIGALLQHGARPSLGLSILATAVVLIKLTVDLLNFWLDPRIRYD